VTRPARRAAIFVGYGRWVSIPVGSSSRCLNDTELAAAQEMITDARRAIELRRRGLLDLSVEEARELARIETRLWPSGGPRPGPGGGGRA
jgi:hypothetical protein